MRDLFLGENGEHEDERIREVNGYKQIRNEYELADGLSMRCWEYVVIGFSYDHKRASVLMADGSKKDHSIDKNGKLEVFDKNGNVKKTRYFYH